MFWSMGVSLCLSSSLAWHRTPGQVENARGRIFYRVLQPLACGQLGLRGQKHRANGLQTVDTSFSQFCQLEVRGQGKQQGEFCSEPPSGCQTADLSCILTGGGLGDPSSLRTPGGHQTPIREGPALITSPKPNRLPEMPFVRDRGSTYGLGGHKPSVHNCLQYHSLLP